MKIDIDFFHLPFFGNSLNQSQNERELKLLRWCKYLLVLLVFGLLPIPNPFINTSIQKVYKLLLC